MGQAAAGVDGAMWTKQGPVQEFKANVGVVATVKDKESFPKHYSKAVADACKKEGVAWNRPFCRATDLRYVAGSDASTTRVIEEILRNTKADLQGVQIVYTLLFPSTVPKVFMYSMDPPVVSLSAMDFQDKLQHPYPHLCLWAYLQALSGQKPSLVSDHFAGETTLAWEFVLKHCPPKVYFDGGNTNAMVSLADILIRLVDERIGQQKLFDVLAPQTLPGFLPELAGGVDTFYLGQKYLKDMVPQRRQKIDTAPLVAHPILFVVKEPTSILTSDFIERSSVMDGIYQEAVKLGGCVKFFDQRDSNDQRLIQPGDIFLWVGEHGKRFVESLPGLAYKGLKSGEAKNVHSVVKV